MILQLFVRTDQLEYVWPIAILTCSGLSILQVNIQLGLLHACFDVNKSETALTHNVLCFRWRYGSKTVVRSGRSTTTSIMRSRLNRSHLEASRTRRRPLEGPMVEARSPGVAVVLKAKGRNIPRWMGPRVVTVWTQSLPYPLRPVLPRLFPHSLSLNRPLLVNLLLRFNRPLLANRPPLNNRSLLFNRPLPFNRVLLFHQSPCFPQYSWLPCHPRKSQDLTPLTRRLQAN